MDRENELYLVSVLASLGTDALLDAAGLSSVQRTRSHVHVQALDRPGIHPVGVVHVTNGSEKASVFAKAQRADYHGAQNLQREFQFLSETGPRISAENRALRSPKPIAYYPERGLLLMEFVSGDSLKKHLFDFGSGVHPTSHSNLAQLLKSTGRWLGALHRLTQQSASGNPLEWLLGAFESKRIREIFEKYSQKGQYEEILSILRRCTEGKPQFRRNLCEVHGEFTPIHVIVGKDGIYVVDYGNTKTGYVYEDIGLFDSFYDCLLPWRSIAGTMRVRISRQKELFHHGYFEQAPSAFNTADLIIMSWVRLLSLARILEGNERRYSGLGKWAYSHVALFNLRNKFISRCSVELASLRNIQLDIFDKDPQPLQKCSCAACGRPVRAELEFAPSGEAPGSLCSCTAFPTLTSGSK